MRIALIVLLVLLFIGGFIYTVNRPLPQAISLLVPTNEGADSVEINKPDEVFTVILTDSSKIYYYTGEFSSKAEIKKTSYQLIREILTRKRKELSHHLVVIIKSDAKATKKNIVDMLDEMSIVDVKRYALVDLNKAEADRLGLTMVQEQ